MYKVAEQASTGTKVVGKEYQKSSHNAQTDMRTGESTTGMSEELSVKNNRKSSSSMHQRQYYNFCVQVKKPAKAVYGSALYLVNFTFLQFAR